MLNTLNVIAINTLFASVMLAVQVVLAPEVHAHGVVNGDHCYNGWHLLNGRCHKPHAEHNDRGTVQRFVKNGGHCYNDWYLDRKTGKCKKSLGWLESESDMIELD